MDINEKIVSALAPVGLAVAETLYEGDDNEFITFNITDDVGEDFGDDDPGCNDIYIHVHYVCPWETDYSGRKKQIRKALYAGGFTWPSVVDASDPSTRLRHIVFECATDNDFDITEDE